MTSKSVQMTVLLEDRVTMSVDALVYPDGVVRIAQRQSAPAIAEEKENVLLQALVCVQLVGQELIVVSPTAE